MKLMKKIITLLIVISMIAAVAPAVFAAGSGAGSYVAGSSVNVGFLYTNELGVQGTISFSNPDLFVEDVQALKPVFACEGKSYNAKTLYWMGWNSAAGDVGISFALTIKSNAQVGDSCTITHTYEVTLPDYNLSETRTESVTITVKAAEPKPTEPQPTETQPTEPKPTEPKPTEPKPTQPKPTEPTVKVDYTELNKQIGIAQGLDGSKYTDDSWAALEKALEDAKALTDSKDQSAVDAAAKALKDAIAALVEMDYSALLEAMGKVDTLNKENALADLFKQLYDAVAEGKALLSSRDQSKVDACTAKILDLLTQIAAKLEELRKTETVIVEKEVEVEVMPDGDYCNIHIHKVWPILFWISLALNIGFAAVIVIYFVKKKKNRKDNTPLVDYDISDDEV